MLVQDTRNANQRMSANIEDWLVDSRKSFEMPVKNLPAWEREVCVCENGEVLGIVNDSIDEGKPSQENKSQLHETPCRRGSKRHSIIAGLRYKYFKPHVETEDLVKNTPSKLEGFFTRILHIQKKHKFDGRKKTRSKPSYDAMNDRPRLRSFRMFSTHKERSAGEISPVNLKVNGVENQSEAKCYYQQSNATNGKSLVTSPREETSINTASLAKRLYNEGTTTTSSFSTPYTDYKTTASSCAEHMPTTCSCVKYKTNSISPAVSTDEFEENENTFSKTWSESAFRVGLNTSRNTVLNGFGHVEAPLARCFSESDVQTPRITTNNKTQILTAQASQKNKHKKNWNILSFFNKSGKEKEKT